MICRVFFFCLEISKFLDLLTDQLPRHSVVSWVLVCLCLPSVLPNACVSPVSALSSPAALGCSCSDTVSVFWCKASQLPLIPHAGGRLCLNKRLLWNVVPGVMVLLLPSGCCPASVSASIRNCCHELMSTVSPVSSCDKMRSGFLSKSHCEMQQHVSAAAQARQ